MIPAKLIVRDKALLTTVQQKSFDFVNRVMPDLTQVTAQGAGAVFRTLATGTINQFGNLARIASTASYGDMRASVLPSVTPLNVTTTVDVTPDAIDPVVGYAMSHFVRGNLVEASAALASGVGTTVAGHYRSTARSLSVQDDFAVGYQRIAGPRACAFCSYAAVTQNTYQFSSTRPAFETMEKFHAHCGCSLVPLFKNVSVFRAPYLDNMADEIAQAEIDIKAYAAQIRPTWEAEWKASGGRMGKNLSRDFFRAHPEATLTTENILARVRKSAGRN